LDRILPVIPAYANDMTVINDIMAGKRTVPTSSIGAGLAAILTASETINVILRKKMPKAPHIRF